MALARFRGYTPTVEDGEDCDNVTFEDDNPIAYAFADLCAFVDNTKAASDGYYYTALLANDPDKLIALLLGDSKHANQPIDFTADQASPGTAGE